jgi:hypothetical protein
VYQVLQAMVGDVQGGDIKYIFLARHFENDVPSAVAHLAIDQGLPNVTTHTAVWADINKR